MRLLTGPVYGARDRARVIRALGELPGASNEGVTKDARGRTGIEIHLPAERVAFPQRPRPRMSYRTWVKPSAPRETYSREIIAVFDVDAGLLLQYRVANEFGRFGMRDSARPWNYIVVDAQERQSEPSPTEDVVEEIPRPVDLSRSSVIEPAPES